MVSVSISILTKGRLDCLSPLFDAISKEIQTNNADCEVNIIDDSTPNDRLQIQKMCYDHGFNYHYFEGGISPKRNEAIRLSQKEVIWFVDSDCEPQAGSLKAYLDSYENNSVCGMLGVVEFVGKKPFFWSVIEQAGYTNTFSFAKFMYYALWGPCANICFRKTGLEAIGGFKEEFPYDFSGEDVDIGLRLNKQGFHIKCSPNAIVYHDTKTWLSIFPFCRKIFRWGRTDYYLMRDHYDMTFPEYPRFMVILFFVCLLALIPGISPFSPLYFLLLVPILIWTCRFLAKEARLKDFFTFFCSFYLKQIFELGFIFESLKHLKAHYPFKKILYGTPQLSFEISDRTNMSIGMLIAIILSLFL